MKRKILIYLTTTNSFEVCSNMIARDVSKKICGDVLFDHKLAI